MANKTTIDWQPIKTEFLADQKVTLAFLAEKYKVSYDTLTHKAHDEKWSNLRQEAQKLIQDKTIEKVTDQIAKVNARQANLGVALQNVAVRALQKKDEQGNPTLEATTIDEVRLLALTGVTIERKALDIEKEGNTPIAIQINFGSPEVEEWAK